MIEPMYTTEVACELIPISVTNLGNILFKYKDMFPPRFDTLTQGAPRMFTETECLQIRNIVIQNKTTEKPRGLSTLRTRQARSFARQKALWKAVAPHLVG